MPDDYILSPVAKKHCRELSCPLLENRFVRKQVPTEVHRGGTNQRGMGVDVMFIAEAPGRIENDLGRPVIGGTGKILRQLVRKLNNDTENGVAYGNIVRCRPVQEDDPRKDRSPTPEESKCCRNLILSDIMKIKPAHIVLLGRSAVSALSIDKRTREPVANDAKIFNLRGMNFVVQTPDGEEYPAIATFHFAFISRSPGMGGVFESDVARAFYSARNVLPDYSARGKPVTIVDTVDRVRKLLKHMVTGLDKKTIVAMDYETTHLYRVNNEVLTIGFAFSPDKAYVIPYRHPESPWSPNEFKEVRRLLRKFFTSKKVSFRSLTAHNLKFECAITLDEFGVSLWNLPLEDTMLRAHGLNENRKGVMQSPFGLKQLSDELLGFKGYYEKDILPVLYLRNHRQKTLKEAQIGPLCEYNGMDCYVTFRVHDVQERIAAEEGYVKDLQRLGLYMHGQESMFGAIMERNGIKVSKKILRYLMSKGSPIVGRLFAIEDELRGLSTVQQANRDLLKRVDRTRGMVGIWGKQAENPWLFHINKPDSQKALFVDILHLSTQTTKKTNRPKIDNGFYKEHKGVHEVDLASEWKSLDKLRGTYVESIYTMLQHGPEMRDGRIRAYFNFHIVRTGRTSSSEPNMQNIPKGKTETALAVKRVYTVEPGNLMVCADYSQAEVRWLAQITGDPLMRKAFEAVAKVQKAYLDNPTEKNRRRMLEEGDFHRQMASQIFSKPAHKVTDLERGASKALVFGIIYGMSIFGISETLKISLREAEDFQDKFLSQFPTARKWLNDVEKNGFKNGYVASPIGRRRHLVSGFVVTDDNEYYEVNGKKFSTDVGKFRAYEDRVCRNAPIQSIASDTNIMACIKLQKYIERHNRTWLLLNIVHDSIIVEVPRDEVFEYVEVANRIMTDPDLMKQFGVRMSIPFVADFSIGHNWADQVAIDIQEKYVVKCMECKKERDETSYPKNKRCEECGSTSIDIELKSAPLEKALKYCDRVGPIWEEKATGMR
jgi:uracil-DNA glycosylase family 4